MATVRSTIEDALRLIGQLAEGEPVSDDTYADSLSAFNDMLDSWSTERLSVFSTEDQEFTWPVDTDTRTLGPTGNFVGNRPVQVDDSTYFVVNDLSYPLGLINEAQYNAIAQKGNTSTYPSVMWVNYTMPDITMKIYPVPTSTLEMHIINVNVLTETDDLDDEIIVPAGYRRAFRYNLGVEFASEFGIDAPPRVLRIADISKRNLKRINNPNDVMSMPARILRRRGNDFNIFTGEPF